MAGKSEKHAMFCVAQIVLREVPLKDSNVFKVRGNTLNQHKEGEEEWERDQEEKGAPNCEEMQARMPVENAADHTSARTWKHVRG
jgi:hypothetical protein